MKEQAKNVEQIIYDGVKSGSEVTAALITPLIKPVGEITANTLVRTVQKKLRK